MSSIRSWLGLLPFAFIVTISALHCSGTDAPIESVVDGGITDDNPGDEDADVPVDAGKKTPDAGQPTCDKHCNGCCNGTTCETAASATKCGVGASACKSCIGSASGNACVAGSCGCLNSGDCATGFSCNSANHTCEKGCSSAEPCASGCCTNAGLCAVGTEKAACGTGNSCVDCTFGLSGHACLTGGKCGCSTADDCSFGYACDTATHTCSKNCSPTALCNGGCCGSAGTCVNSSKTTCASGGAACVDCTGNPLGGSCVGTGGKTCGCFGALDCPGGQACDLTTHACTTACSATQQCNGGCCDLGTKTCAAGTLDNQCGGVKPGFVATCESCTVAITGGKCEPASGSYLGKCGCVTPSDCSTLATCSSGRCCLPKGKGSANAGLCCSGVTLNQVCQ